MIKTLLAADRSERERFKIPRSVQQSIPIQRIYRDGIWEVDGKFSRCWRFTDINYAVSDEEDKKDTLIKYCALEKGLLVLTAKDKVRLLPALNIPDALLAEGLDILQSILDE